MSGWGLAGDGPLTCVDCGIRMVRSKGSKPQGQARCHPCRRKRPAPWRGTICPVCGKPKAAGAVGNRPCRKCDRIGSRQPRPCEVCGKTYKPTHTLQRSCGRACGVVLRGLIPESEKSKASRVEMHQCRHCPQWISKPEVKLCGPSCRKLDQKIRAREAFVSQAQPTTVSCADCGEDYTTATARNLGVCLRCQKRRHKGSDRHRARLAGVQYEPISRRRVYERDGWRCGLCGKKVNRTAKAPHPMSASLDHVIPISQGGDHLYANVQCAHFLCNSLKGAGGSQQLALVG